jgi:O-antigen ligase
MPIVAVFFISVYCFGLLKTITSKPIYGLFTYLFAFYLHPPSNYWGEFVPDIRWSLIAAIFTFLAVLVKNRDIGWIFFKFVETKLFFIFVVYVLIQNLWAVSPILHWEYTIMAIKFLILIFLIQNCIHDEKDVIKFIIVNILGCCYFGYVGLTSNFEGRMEGVGGPGIASSNGLAQHLIVVLIFTSFLLLCKYGKKLFLLFPFIALILQTLVMAGSRSAFLALGATGVFSIFFTPKSVRKKLYLYGFLAIIAGSVVIGPHLIERFKSMQTNESGEISDKSARSRMIIINAQFEMFKESPLLGHGHSGTFILSPFYIDESYRTSRSGGEEISGNVTRRASHNFIMTLLVDHGLIGAFIYLYIIYKCLIKLFLLNKIETVSNQSLVYKILLTGFLLSLLAFMIAGLGSNNKIFEIGIWLYAIIPLIHDKLTGEKKV